MSDSRHPHRAAVRPAARRYPENSEDPARSGDEPRPEDPARVPAETPEADAVEQHTDVVEDDEGQVWEPGPDEADAADATEQKHGVGKPDEDEYR